MNLILYVIYAIILYLIFKTDGAYEIFEQEEKCKNCGTSIDHNAEFCPHCHEGVKRACKDCGKLIELDWRYCPFCNDSYEKKYLDKWEDLNT